MCGFAGFLGFNRLSAGAASNVAVQMGAVIKHRGPDDGDVWCDEESQVALAHRRLSILDLSPAGHQPMVSSSGRYVIAFNGEIYNHLDLRTKIEKIGHCTPSNLNWRGNSDTETLLAGFEAWGVENTLQRCVGMFAFALWDKAQKELIFARDRLGEKPLYYGLHNGVLLFGSELKALKMHPAFIGEIDRNSIALQMRHNYIPSPYSIYKNIRKLPAGTILRARIDSPLENPIPYWSLQQVIQAGLENPFDGSSDEAIVELESMLSSTVAMQMRADVPLGAFLSGGVDSSTIVALMQAHSLRRVKTFTIGFEEGAYDEAVYAKEVAKHLNTEHTVLYVSPQQALNVIPILPTLYDEPFSDSSQIPTFLLSQLTRQHVTVSLSGDGGDELFGGYDRYSKIAFWRSRIPTGFYDLKRLGGRLTSIFSSIDQNRSESWHQLHDLLMAKNNSEFYLPRVSHWKRPEVLVHDCFEPETIFTNQKEILSISDFYSHMMALDTLSYLPDDILVKVDRAAMGVSLETRVPLLDHRIVEFAWKIPLNMKVFNDQNKWILKQVLHKYVPAKLIERPKMGFGVPIDSWLRGPLRDWAESLLEESRLNREGFFNPIPIRRKWHEHLSGHHNWQYHLWDILMFQAWLEQEQAK